MGNIVITVDGRLAYTTGQAAARYNRTEPVMRMLLSKRRYAVEPVERLDGKPLYDAERLDAVMGYLPGPAGRTTAGRFTPPEKGTPMDASLYDLGDRYEALVTADTRTVIDLLVDCEVRREYGHNVADEVRGATVLALAGITLNIRPLWIEINGDDDQLPAAAKAVLRVFVERGLADRRCQCPDVNEHGHRGSCEGHYEHDVPPVRGGRLCGTCYGAVPGA